MNNPGYDIVLAQAFSDNAKGINSILNVYTQDESNYYKYNSYSEKEKYIQNAIRKIQKHKNPNNISFYVTRDKNLDSFLVYFNFKLGSDRYQISFHCFDYRLEKFAKGSQPCKTKWDKKSSRDAAITLAYCLGMIE